MSILGLTHIGSLADGTAPRESVLDRLFLALYRARMIQAARVVARHR
ncbi:hypothetical protein A33M_3122 [Rhodovulum sp. PH10]|nr:hypothetical protein [Rhodovulum sp. PH10]EJW11509.1 hypothetical protein A33M_3122 [Rhodovulum sp. PH10]